MRNNVICRALFFALALGFACAGANAQGPESFRSALNLYENGMYERARTLFEALAARGDVAAEGYAILCAVESRADAYEVPMREYLARRPYSALKGRILFRDGLNRFDDGDYAGASASFAEVEPRSLPASLRTEFAYKRAYAAWQNGDVNYAEQGFREVTGMAASGYTAPAHFALGSIRYKNRQFSEARESFAAARPDGRFTAPCSFYLLECDFLLGRYKDVVREGPALYADSPEDRKPHLARIISEASLVEGDADLARTFFDAYDKAGEKSRRDRSDWFLAGSVRYGTGDWKGAAESFDQVEWKADSLDQVACYKKGDCLVREHNKVAAADAFRKASELAFDKGIQEDAFFNYAKLEFDLNKNRSVFAEYLKRYGGRERSQRVWSYMALSCLYDRDYTGAIEAYDQIDELDKDMKSNYMKANYLRAVQLINGGNWRGARPCLRAAAYYAEKESMFNQLANYWLAEAEFRDGEYDAARDGFTALYNASALYGTKESALLPFNIAYCHFKKENFEVAERWFGEYLEARPAQFAHEASVRRADCAFMRKDYALAAQRYEAVARESDNPDDIYPYLQGGLAYGLLKKQDKRIELLSRVRKATPGVPLWGEAMYEHGRACVLAGRDAEAEESFLILADKSQDTLRKARALTELAMISRNRGKLDAALEHYGRVVKMVPGSDEAEASLQAIESIYAQKGEPDKYFAYVSSLGPEASRSGMSREELVFLAAEQVYLSGEWEKALAALSQYRGQFPSGSHLRKADFYSAECYRATERKEQACDLYRKVMDGDDSFAESATASFADLSLSMEQYKDAFEGYSALERRARLPENRDRARLGLMRAAYGARDWAEAVTRADAVREGAGDDAELLLEADYIRAKSLLYAGRRDEALSSLERLIARPKTAQGAEAYFLLVQDAYSRGDFALVEKRVYAFSGTKTPQNYWLARAFIVLGDSFAERGKSAQAKATYESILSGYHNDDDVTDLVKARLGRIETHKEND